MVVGTDRALGHAVAQAFGQHGATVAVLGSDHRLLVEAVTSLSVCVEEECFHAYPSDLSDPTSVARIIEKVMADLGPIDVLVVNTGVLSAQRPVHEVRHWELESSFEQNFWVPFRILRKLVPVMLDRERGVIINVCIDGVEESEQQLGAYGIAMAAREAMSRALSADLEMSRVRAYSVYPGPVVSRTLLQSYPGADLTGLPSPREVADLFVLLASKDGSSIPTGPIRWKQQPSGEVERDS